MVKDIPLKCSRGDLRNRHWTRDTEHHARGRMHRVWPPAPSRCAAAEMQPGTFECPPGSVLPLRHLALQTEFHRLDTTWNRANWSGIRQATSLRKASNTSKVGIRLAGYSSAADCWQ